VDGCGLAGLLEEKIGGAFGGFLQVKAVPETKQAEDLPPDCDSPVLETESW
jgi:hypothetical protein